MLKITPTHSYVVAMLTNMKRTLPPPHPSSLPLHISELSSPYSLFCRRHVGKHEEYGRNKCSYLQVVLKHDLTVAKVGRVGPRSISLIISAGVTQLVQEILCNQEVLSLDLVWQFL